MHADRSWSERLLDAVGTLTHRLAPCAGRLFLVLAMLLLVQLVLRLELSRRASESEHRATEPIVQPQRRPVLH